MAGDGDPKEILKEAQEYYDASHLEEALECVRPLLSRQGRLNHADRIDMLRLIGRCSLELGDYERARQAFDTAARIAADLDRFDLAIAQFNLCRFDEAEMVLETLPVYPEIEAEVCWYRGLLAERRGDFDLADSLFRRAARLEPKNFTPPQHLEDDTLRDLFSAVVEDLPAEIRDVAVEVPLTVEELPSDALIEGPEVRVHPLALGMYLAPPTNRRSAFSPDIQADRIVLFRRNIMKFFGDREELLHQMRHTFIIEIGHHRLGLTEEELEERGF